MVEEDAPSRAAASRAAASPEEEEASPEEEEAFPEEEEALLASCLVVMVLVRAAETNASAVAYLLPWAAAAEAAEEAAAGEVL